MKNYWVAEPADLLFRSPEDIAVIKRAFGIVNTHMRLETVARSTIAGAMLVDDPHVPVSPEQQAAAEYWIKNRIPGVVYPGDTTASEK